MASTLQQVLSMIENAPVPLTVAQIAQALEIEPGIVDGMIEHWVRKGRLRQTGSQMNCGTCGSADGCPFVRKMPRSYELADGDYPQSLPPPTCHCCH